MILFILFYTIYCCLYYTELNCFKLFLKNLLVKTLLAKKQNLKVFFGSLFQITAILCFTHCTPDYVADFVCVLHL